MLSFQSLATINKQNSSLNFFTSRISGYFNIADDFRRFYETFNNNGVKTYTNLSYIIKSMKYLIRIGATQSLESITANNNFEGYNDNALPTQKVSLFSIPKNKKLSSTSMLLSFNFEKKLGPKILLKFGEVVGLNKFNIDKIGVKQNSIISSSKFEIQYQQKKILLIQ